MRWTFVMFAFFLLYSWNANAVIINLDSRVNDLGHPVSLSLEPGTYSITPIGTADGGLFDAWNAWGRTTCSNPDGCMRTSPTTVVGWLNLYSFSSSDLLDVIVNDVAALPVSGDTYYVDTAMVYPDPLSALAHALSAEFTLEIASTISFAIPDRPLYDNRGGMSLDVTATAIPEPTTVLLLGLGLAGIVITRRKTARN